MKRHPSQTMRIISGSLKGRRLSCPEGTVTRPSSALVRGAIFNILGEAVDGAEVLDLYAGTGALGLEALSRGAGHVVLVESDRRAARILANNVAALDVGRKVDIVLMDCRSYLNRCRSRFQLVLADPPYDQDLSGDLLDRLAGVMGAGSVLVLQEPSSRQPSQGNHPLQLWKTRIHGRHRITLYRYQDEERK